MRAVFSCQIKRSILLMIAAAASLSIHQSYAASVSCSTTITNMNFGNVDFINSPLPNSNIATLRYQCENNSAYGRYVNACLYLGDTPLGNRISMYNSADDEMRFILKDTATNKPWGTVSSQNPLQFVFYVPGKGKKAANVSVTGDLIAGQKTLPSGSYQSRFNPSGALLTWREDRYASPLSCVQERITLSLEFVATANIQKNCNVWTSDINFGSPASLDDSSVETQGALTVECTPSAQYKIALRSSNGQQGQQFYLYPLIGGASSGVKVAYTLFQNSGRTVFWGDGTNAKAAMGSGDRQIHPIYARLLAGQTASLAAGDYQDTVIVTISF